MVSIEESNAKNAKVDLTVDVNGKRVIDVSHPEKTGGDVPTLRGIIMIMYLPKNCKLYFFLRKCHFKYLEVLLLFFVDVFDCFTLLLSFEFFSYAVSTAISGN